MRIMRLSPEVANQIAAGEVIERPASVVKELLENAQDAQADSIAIDIGYGGLNEVTVSDNGLGIVAEDLPLAVAAHATSKITALDDLQAIYSMGFRGEALASIASVAKLRISSRPESASHGMMFDCQEQEKLLVPCARNQGTTIEVKDIFYNAPVRKKFLKSVQQEFQAIESLVKRFAMASPGTALILRHNAKVYLNLPKALDETARKLRMMKILGKAFVDSALYLDVSHGDMSLQGYISDASYQRSQNDRLWVYLNGRMIRDRLILQAIKQVYEPVLYPGRHPACLLYLTMDPQMVDVNVHPTKHEVRFQDPRLVHDFIRSSLSKLIQQNAEHEAEKGYKPKLVPAKAETHCEAKLSRSWLPLSPPYVLVFLANEPYLVDLDKLKQDYLLHALQNASYPLARRSLLVAVELDPANKSREFGVGESRKFGVNEFQEVGALFDNFGLHIESVNNQLLLKTLPILIPHLEIRPFFEACFKHPCLSAEVVCQYLARYQSVELDSEEYELFLSRRLREAKAPLSGVKHLSAKACQELLYEA